MLYPVEKSGKVVIMTLRTRIIDGKVGVDRVATLGNFRQLVAFRKLFWISQCFRVLSCPILSFRAWSHFTGDLVEACMVCLQMGPIGKGTRT